MNVIRVNEIFYSLQGEGFNTGRAAVFVRLSGCNRKCPFCDTDFSKFREMSETEIVAEVSLYPTRFVVLTGGEPGIQVTESLIDLLHEANFEVAIETNGSVQLPKNIDWVTVSPKGGELKAERCNELKIVFEGTSEPTVPTQFENARKYLQPMDTGDKDRNSEIVRRCVEYIKSHPQWRLSLQTHKLVGFT
ncbi:MAG: radical SAM protein [Prevotella sp.]|nr:radical SAM protein [Prevotella sp.]